MRQIVLGLCAITLLTPGLFDHAAAQDFADLDKTVRTFLDRHRGTWRDINVPESDGRILHDLILKRTNTPARSRSERPPATRACG